MEIQALRRRDQLLVGFTLFSMFFGAGNLIFPPQLGAQAGVDTWFAMAGLAVSAVFLPILGVIAVVRAGSLTELASRVHPAFATVFTVLIYLSIGPCLAIPRTASTSFEMAVPPFLPSGTPTMWFQFGYSLLFFCRRLPGGPSAGEADWTAGQVPVPRAFAAGGGNVRGQSGPSGGNLRPHPAAL